MNASMPFEARVAQVVASGNCSGCGACALLDTGLSMEMDEHGYMRPVRRRPVEARDGIDDIAPAFDQACPGVSVAAQRPVGSRRNPQLGPVVQAWEAWATEPVVRHMGSSGGVLTALSAWLLETGQSARVIGAQGDAADARRTVTVELTTKEQALRASGSRYAPVSNAAHQKALEPDTVFVGKPCEVSALRALEGWDDGKGPILLSFFCAGTPSQESTFRITEAMGITSSQKIVELRYRGNGWPGEFAVVGADDSRTSMSYEESWGKYLGPTTQWRCKICPDGVGESADISAGDFWRTDENGYPMFSDQPGSSAVLARTERGRDLVLAAARASILTLAPLDQEALVSVQPLQRKRRSTLFARLAGTVAGGGKVPRYRGFGLFRMSLPVLRQSLRTARGTYRRYKGGSS